MKALRVVYVDSYDSFAHNVVHLLAAQGARVDVVRSDEGRLEPSLLSNVDLLVVGPGPGFPAHYPRLLATLRAAVERAMPTLGVCLGMQAIGEVCGARVVHAPVLMHGKTSDITHDASLLFAGVPSPVRVTRYHSLCLQEPLPEPLRASAHSSDGVVQAVAHVRAPIFGVQFHPESILSEYGDRIVGNMLTVARGA